MKRLYFLLAIVVILSCNNNKQAPKHDASNKTMVGSSLKPSVYNALFVFAKGNDDSVYCIEGEKLVPVYKKSYSTTYSTYELFLNAASKGQINLLAKGLSGHDVIKFYIDRDVKDQYINTHSIKGFLEKYCNRYDHKLVVKSVYNPNRNKVFSILYYAFINNYEVLQDDYSGGYVIKE